MFWCRYVLDFTVTLTILEIVILEYLYWLKYSKMQTERIIQ